MKNRSMLDAVKTGNAEVLKSVAESGADLSELTQTGMTVLAVAASRGHVDCVKALLNAGVDPNAYSVGGYTALHAALSKGYVDCAEALLGGGARLDAPVQYCPELLELLDDLDDYRHGFGSSYGPFLFENESIEQAFEASNIDPDSLANRIAQMRDSLIESPHSPGALDLALYGGCADCVRLVLDAGRDSGMRIGNGVYGLVFFAQSRLGWNHIFPCTESQWICPFEFSTSAFEFDASANDPDDLESILDTLIDAKFDLEQDATLSRVAMSIARCNTGLFDKVLSLKGIDVNAASDRGEGGLWDASARGLVDRVKMLLEAGADPAAYGGSASNNSTALHAAAGSGNLECVRLLLDAGASVHAKDHSGCTPLFYAFERCEDNPDASNAMMELLVDAGAKVDEVDRFGNTILHGLASESYRCIRRAIELGASIEQRNKAGHTPLGYGLRRGQELSVRTLIDAGAQIDGVKVGRFKLRTFAHREGWVHVVDAIDRRSPPKRSRRAKTSSDLSL